MAFGRLSLVPAKLTTAVAAASAVGIAYLAKVPMPHAGLQATIAAAVAAELSVPSFGKAAAERWSRILGMKFEINDDLLKTLMLSLDPGFRCDALKTCLNGRTTIARLHAPTRACLFGCTHADDLDDAADYLKECTSLADATDSIFATPPVPFASLLRFGLSPVAPGRATGPSLCHNP